MEKKKIVHLFWSLTFGGIETMLINIANAQAEMGADVSVVIVNDMVEPVLLHSFNKRVKVLLMKRKVGSRNILPFLCLNKTLLGLHPDAIHLHESDLFGCLWFKCLSRVTSVTLHALPFGMVRREGLLYKLLHHGKYEGKGNVENIDKIPRVFAISKAVHDMLLDRYHINSVVVNNGIKTETFLQREGTEWHKPLRVIQVSRLDHEKKGQDLLIDAASQLKGTIDVTFIGDGNSMGFLKQSVKTQGVDDFVHFLGKQDQSFIAKNLYKYDLFVQASRWEGFGLTVAEAMAAKVPVLVSEGQGPAEVTCGEKYGWLFRNGDSSELAKQIRHIMLNRTDALSKAEAACRYVQETYDVSVTARKYLDNYPYVSSCSSSEEFQG